MKHKYTTNRYGKAKETIAIQFINGVFQWIQCYQNNRVQCFMSHTSQCETFKNDENEEEKEIEEIGQKRLNEKPANKQTLERNCQQILHVNLTIFIGHDYWIYGIL